ncbi:MAG: hypothetical protein GXP27_14255, partial [Planctomycetes bacterium]|nr:hypothetical protein [Planctomycetota bacterium]
MQNRRQFLQSTVRNSALISLTPTLPGFLAKTAIAAEAKPDDRILVVLFLDGGNDGINTVVPYADEGYAKHRDKLRLPTDRLIKINDSVGLQRSLRGLGELLDSDRLAIIQGVGYSNPDLSHFRSGAIWQTASLVEPETQSHGWLGRSLDSSAQPNNVADSVFIGNGDVPIALRGRRSVSLAMQTPEDLLLDPAAARVGSLQEQDEPLVEFVRGTLQNAYLSADRMAELVQAKEAGPSYPRTALAGHLQTIA